MKKKTSDGEYVKGKKGGRSDEGRPEDTITENGGYMIEQTLFLLLGFFQPRVWGFFSIV